MLSILTLAFWGLVWIIQAMISVFMYLISAIAISSLLCLAYTDIVIRCIPPKQSTDGGWIPGVDILSFCILCYYEMLVKYGSHDTMDTLDTERIVIKWMPLMFIIDIGLLIWCYYAMINITLLPLCLLFRFIFVYFFFQWIGTY
jgi:hypothetical protein